MRVLLPRRDGWHADGPYALCRKGTANRILEAKEKERAKGKGKGEDEDGERVTKKVKR